MFRFMLLMVAMAAGGIAVWMALASPPSASLPAAETEGPRLVEVLVAAQPIPQGTRLDPEHLTWQPWPENAVAPSFITRAARPQAITDLAGAVMRTPVVLGELILSEKFVQSDRGYLAVVLTPGKRAVAVNVTQASSAGGFILPNDRVDVLQTVGCQSGEDGCQAGKSARTILENVRVLAVDQIGSRDGSSNALVGKTATVELEPWQAEKIVSAQATGLLTLVLRPAVEVAKPKVSETAPKPKKVDKGYSVKVRRAGGSTETVTFK